MTPQEYESVVSEIVAGIHRSAPELALLSLGAGPRNRILGASSYKHQIDVSLAGASDIYLLECKRWNDKVGVQEIMVLAARGTDIAQSHGGATVHGIVATTVGATRGAIMLALYFNIAIEIVRSAQEFGMRIGKRVHVGVADRATFSDSVKTTLTRDGVIIP